VADGGRAATAAADERRQLLHDARVGVAGAGAAEGRGAAEAAEEGAVWRNGAEAVGVGGARAVAA
jgi:hypothetical protein